ncbi:MAG: hypothetical protein LBU79_09465 [Planctomycetota bacterium]|nr:hypothetical protein [Planctomycetota bacterium]
MADSKAKSGKTAKKSAGKGKTKSITREIFGHQSWRLASDQVELFLTRHCGHMGPVTFFRGKEKFAPMALAPWYKETKLFCADPLLRVLRGDFFCLPFGANQEARGKEKYFCHGETANRDWSFLSQGAGEVEGESAQILRTEIRTRARKSRVEKILSLRGSDQAVYIRHNITGLSGPMPYGHHAMLHFDKQGTGLISTSRFKYGQVAPGAFETAETFGYQSLKPGATFTSLSKVPRLDGTTADLSVYPARLGFEDLVLLYSDPKGDFAWSAAVYPEKKLVWFALKNANKLASTILWHSNHGRYYSPWNGRHVGVIGIEEVTGYFAQGLIPSIRQNSLTKQGMKTNYEFKADELFSVPYITAAARVPAGFDHVKSILPLKEGVVRLTSKSGKSVDSQVAWQFLQK